MLALITSVLGWAPCMMGRRNHYTKKILLSVFISVLNIVLGKLNQNLKDMGHKEQGEQLLGPWCSINRRFHYSWIISYLFKFLKLVSVSAAQQTTWSVAQRC